MVPASINVDQEKIVWVAEPVLEYPEWDYECFHCGKETEEHEGYLRDGECYCDSCAYDLFDQPMPKSKYTQEMWDKFAGCQPPKDDVWEDLDKIIIKEDIVKCSMCGYQEEKCYSWRYKFTVYCNVCAIEHGNKIIAKPRVIIIPPDAIIIDDDYVYCKTFDEAKEILNRASCRDTDVTQDLTDAYIVSQNNGKFWFVLTQDLNIPTKFIITVYASKGEVATKYLRRMLEECVYRMDYLINPDDYPCEEDSSLEDASLHEDCATEEDEANFYREQAANQIAEEQNDMAQNDIDVEMDNYDTYYTKKALCVTCGEINYAEPVCEVEGRSRMVCCDCIEIVNTCQECHNLTLDCLYESRNDEGVIRDLCFNCKFKKSVREQMLLAVHLAIRSDIQRLEKKQFDILVDYAELCEFTIFDAYRYKSRCHFYDCDRMVPPMYWNAEYAVQFCCRRHCDLADLNGCHCQNVYDGSDYDEDWEKATCKVCNNSNHDTNMIPRIALRESDKGVNPIVSAICVFEEGIKMYNVLAESLVDLCEYFG